MSGEHEIVIKHLPFFCSIIMICIFSFGTGFFGISGVITSVASKLNSPFELSEVRIFSYL